MSLFRTLSFVGLFLCFSALGDSVVYDCTIKIHCSQMQEDKSLSFEYIAGSEKKEPKTIDLGIVRGRVFGPHYLSLYLFDTRNPKTIWTKTHSNSLVNDLEVSLVIPEDDEHTMVANLRCQKRLP